MDGEDHRMLDGRLNDIRQAANGIASAIDGLGAILTGFFSAYAKSKAGGPERSVGNYPDGVRNLEELAWHNYLKKPEGEA